MPLQGTGLVHHCPILLYDLTILKLPCPSDLLNKANLSVSHSLLLSVFQKLSPGFHGNDPNSRPVGPLLWYLVSLVGAAHSNTSEKNIKKHSLAVSQTLDFTEQAKNLRAT